MYRLVKDLHLSLGLLMSAFLLIYGASAFMMGHSFLFKWAYPKGQKSVFKVEAPEDPRAIVAAIRDNQGLRGDLYEVKTTSTAVSFFVERPGSRFDVSYDLASQTATMFQKRGGFWYRIDRLHHTGGIHHDDPRMNAWGWFVFVASMLLFCIGFSGVYLWFKRHKERRVGGMIFLASFVFAGGLLTLVRLL